MSNVKRHEDIDLLIREIEHIKVNLNDPCLGPVFWEGAMKDLIGRHAEQIVSLLDELRQLRDKASGGLNATSSHRAIVEGYSDRSASAALSDALDKAAHYFSEQHDISVTLQSLVELPKGGHRATVEVHITPITLKHRCHPAGQDVELKRIHDHNYDSRKKLAEERIKHLVFDHFAVTAGGMSIHIPDYFLININDACLMNYMIEKQFFNAGHGFVPGEPDLSMIAGGPAQILVRVQKPRPELELE